MAKKLSIAICLILMLLPLTVWGCASYQVPENIKTMARGSDLDKDGLSDQQEIIAKTDMNNPDTDGDGLKDGTEIEKQLDPNNPDTDGDTVPDSDDAWPRLNNNGLYISSVASLLVLSLITTTTLHMKVGLTEQRKKIVKSMLEKQKEDDALFRQVRESIERLARQKYGLLALDEAAKELGIDPVILGKFFYRLKARKVGSLYHFGDIEKSYRK